MIGFQQFLEDSRFNHCRNFVAPSKWLYVLNNSLTAIERLLPLLICRAKSDMSCTALNTTYPKHTTSIIIRHGPQNVLTIPNENSLRICSTEVDPEYVAHLSYPFAGSVGMQAQIGGLRT